MKRFALVVLAGVLPVVVISVFPSEYWTELLIAANVLAVVIAVGFALLLLRLKNADDRESPQPDYGWVMKNYQKQHHLN
jgi:hypothetical protein